MRKHIHELEKYRIYLMIAWAVITIAWIIAAFCYYLISIRDGSGVETYLLPTIAACVFFLFGCLPWLTIETMKDAVEADYLEKHGMKQE